MAKHSGGSFLTLGLLAGTVYILLPASNGFLATQSPDVSNDANKSPTPLASGANMAARVPQVSAAAGPGPGGQPNRIDLLFVGTLTGTAVTGRTNILPYGAYSGAGSAL